MTQGPNYSGEKLSLNFQNIEVRSLLQVIADFTNFNIVTSDTVTGAYASVEKMCLGIKLCKLLWTPRAWVCAKQGVFCGLPKDEIDERTKKDYEAALSIQKLEPLKTQAFQLNYAKAADMVTQLTSVQDKQWGR